MWDKTLADRDSGFCCGPYYSEDRVSDVLGTKAWLPMPRFPVMKNAKVRPVDDGSATGSCANNFSHMVEKLEVPSIDMLLAVIKRLHRLSFRFPWELGH